MIPYKTRSGAATFRRVKVYVGVPYEFKSVEAEVLDAAHRDRLSSARYITIGAISTNLGAKY
jgi:large subunit ribosomal protein L13